MPTSAELVTNKPLAGSELGRIIRADVERLLTDDPMLGSLIAYHRVSYEVRITMHMDNYSYPTYVTSVHSRKAAKDQPELSALEAGMPLKNASATSYVSATETHRDITSPNVSRIEHSLPVEILRRDGSGQTQSESVDYPIEMLDEKGPAAVTKDLSDAMRQSFELPELKVCTCGGEVKVNLNGACISCGGVLEFDTNSAPSIPSASAATSKG